jgi:hypothetical protein
MNTLAMTVPIAKGSPRFHARLAGVFEALEGMASSWGQVFILGRLVVFGDAAATAANILGHQRLFWFGFVLSLLGVAFHIVWTLLFYSLFQPVNKSLSLLAAFVGIVVCALQALTAFLYVTPLLVLQGGDSLAAFTTQQLQALAMIFLKLNAYAFDIDLVFFGLWCALTGYLIFRSAFLPRILGVLLALDGVGWMMFVVPPFAGQIFPFIAAASALAEIPLQLWLLAVGVNSQRWKQQASVTGGSSPMLQRES